MEPQTTGLYLAAGIIMVILGITLALVLRRLFGLPNLIALSLATLLAGLITWSAVRWIMSKR